MFYSQLLICVQTWSASSPLDNLQIPGRDMYRLSFLYRRISKQLHAVYSLICDYLLLRRIIQIIYDLFTELIDTGTDDDRKLRMIRRICDSSIVQRIPENLLQHRLCRLQPR